MNRQGAKGAKESVGNEDLESIAHEIVTSAIKVHRALGPGLMESIYQKCLNHELFRLGHEVQCEVPLRVLYDGVDMDLGYRLDMVVKGKIVIENKTVERILPLHQAQILTYLKLGEYPLGFLLNWNVPLMRQGIKRFIHSKAENDPGES